MLEIPLFGTSGILVRAYDRTIHEMDLPVELPLLIGIHLQFLEDPLPQSCLSPPVEASVDRLPGPVAFRQVTPGRASIQDPQDAIDDAAMIRARSSRLRLLRRKHRFDLIPLFIRQFMSVSHILDLNR